MRAAALVLWLVAAAAAEDPHAFVELVADHDVVYVNQPIRLTLRIGYDAAYFERGAIQLFQQKLDLPVHVEAPELKRPALPGEGKTFALNDDVVRARAAESRGRFTVFVFEQTQYLTEPGERTFAAPTMRFATGTQFREDFLHGRVATDRRDTVVTGEPMKLRVLPIPEEGRPKGWAGAVGGIGIRTDAAPRELDDGQSLELKMWITGGNAGTLAAPVLADIGLDEFHVVGSLASEGDGARLFTYTIRPLDPIIDEVPALALPYFDPTPPAQFRRAKSQAIPITIRAKAVDPTPVAESHVDAYIIPGWAVGLAIVAVIAALLLAWRLTRRKESGPSEALARFRAGVDADPADALPAYLAASLRCPVASVISPDLAARLAAAGVPDALAARAAAAVEELVGSRYGGAAVTDDARRTALELVEELEPVFHPRHA